jgi:uncharacterized membrane protein
MSERSNIMQIGPLEYMVIGCNDEHFVHEILPELNALQASDLILVIDLLFLTKDADGAVTLREVSDLQDEEAQAYAGLAPDLAGWLTAEDIKKLAETVPSGTSAVVVLLEHTWTDRLSQAVRQAGGVLFTGGLVSPEAMAHVSAELAAKEESHA